MMPILEPLLCFIYNSYGRLRFGPCPFCDHWDEDARAHLIRKIQSRWCCTTCLPLYLKRNEECIEFITNLPPGEPLFIREQKYTMLDSLASQGLMDSRKVRNIKERIETWNDDGTGED